MSAEVVFDIETNGIEDCDTVWCISQSTLGSDNVLSGSMRQHTLDEHLAILYEADTIVGHNIINFDLPVLKRLKGWTPKPETKVIDTLAISRLLNPDRRKPHGFKGKDGAHSLACWGYRIKRAKPVHEDWSVFSDEMLHRNREDVEINKTVLELLRMEMGDHDWTEAIDLEHKVSRIITQQEKNGVYFDLPRAKSLITELNELIANIDSDINPRLPIKYAASGVEVREPFKNNGQYKKMVLDWYPELDGNSVGFVSGPFTRIVGNKLDINSIAQVKEYFLKNGWIPTEYNYSKKTGQPTSPKLTEDSYGSITGGMGPQIKERLTLAHRRGQIQGWITRLRPDGRLSASANTCGTPTGRFRHRNVVNVPKAVDYVPYGKEMRSLFTVPKGYKLVGCDADQIELRLLAHFMNDPEYIQAILDGDIHSYNQAIAGFETRDQAKTFIYAFLYGAGDEKLGRIIGGDAADGARLKKAFLDGLPKLKALIKRVKTASNKGWLQGLDGRKMWLRRGEGGEVQKHKALNLYIQGADGVFMKKTMVILDELMLAHTPKLDAMKVLDMHDEFQFEVAEKDVDAAVELMEKALVLAGESFNLRIPTTGTAKVGMNWSETH